MCLSCLQDYEFLEDIHLILLVSIILPSSTRTGIGSALHSYFLDVTKFTFSLSSCFSRIPTKLLSLQCVWDQLCLSPALSLFYCIESLNSPSGKTDTPRARLRQAMSSNPVMMWPQPQAQALSHSWKGRLWAETTIFKVTLPLLNLLPKISDFNKNKFYIDYLRLNSKEPSYLSSKPCIIIITINTHCVHYIPHTVLSPLLLINKPIIYIYRYIFICIGIHICVYIHCFYIYIIIFTFQIRKLPNVT